MKKHGHAIIQTKNKDFFLQDICTEKKTDFNSLVFLVSPKGPHDRSKPKNFTKAIFRKFGFQLFV